MAVDGPGDGLGGPILVGAVNADSVLIEGAIGRQSSLGDTARGLVARATTADAAVDSSVGLRDAVDLLEDVDLTSLGPLGAMTHGIAEGPEGGPEPLLVDGGVGADQQAGSDLGDLAGSGGPRADGLDAAGRPVTVLGRLARHELHGAAAADLQVLVRCRVRLHLVVGVDSVHDVPHGPVGRGAGDALELLGPDQVHVPHGRGSNGRSQAGQQREKDTRLEHHLVCCVM